MPPGTKLPRGYAAEMREREKRARHMAGDLKARGFQCVERAGMICVTADVARRIVEALDAQR